MFIKKVNNSDIGDSDHVGGDDWDALDNYFDDINITGPAKINTPTSFRDQKLQLMNPANTQKLTFRNPGISASYDTNLAQGTGYLIFIDPDDSNKIKAKRGKTGAIEFSQASDTGALLNSVLAAISDGESINFVPGSYAGTTQALNVNRKQVQWNGNGATLSGFTIKLNGGGDTTTVGYNVFRDFKFSGASAGLVFDNTFRVTVEHCYFDLCTVGISFESSNKWSELSLLKDCHFNNCTSSIVFKTPTATGTGSYINNMMLHTTFNTDGSYPGGAHTYIDVQSGADVGECKWFNQRFWFNNPDGTGIDLQGTVTRLQLFKPYFEAFSGATNTIGIDLGSTMSGSPFFMGRPTFGGGGTYTAKINNPNNKTVHGPVTTWRQSHSIVPSATANTYGSVVNCLSGEDYGDLPNIYVVIGGTVGAETVSVEIKAITFSALTYTITKTYTATGSYPLAFTDYTALTTANFYYILDNFEVRAKSTATSTAATVTLVGFNGGSAVPGTSVYSDVANTFTAAQQFDNYIDTKVISAPSSPASGYGRLYAKQVDSNNDGLFVKLKVNGAVVEVQLA